jgi:DNA-binding HxlR family transcriptional regulator
MAKTLNTRASSINRALDQIGDKWALLIIQEVFWGINTFNEMMSAIGVSRGVLSDRLRWLQGVECLRKHIPGDNPKRPVYHLTRKSMDLYHTALMAVNWERQFFNTPELDCIALVHDNCGKAFWPVMRCTHCNEAVEADDVTYRQGPGAQYDIRQMKVRRRSSISVSNIPSSRSVYKNLINLVGDRWTANVISLAFHQFKRFDQFHAELPVATNILSDRLKLLTQEGVFRQVPYQQSPVRHEYHLTEKGLALYPYFLALLQWGDKWCGQGNGAPVVLTHTPCGHELLAEVQCGECGERLHAKQVHFTL